MINVVYLYRGVCGNTTVTDVIHLLLGEGREEEEAERILPDDFYYDFDGLVSTAFSTEGIPLQLLSFQYPLYDFSPITTISCYLLICYLV